MRFYGPLKIIAKTKVNVAKDKYSILLLNEKNVKLLKVATTFNVKSLNRRRQVAATHVFCCHISISHWREFVQHLFAVN